MIHILTEVPFYKDGMKKLKEIGISPGHVAGLGTLLYVFFVIPAFPGFFVPAFLFLLKSWPIWIPIFLTAILWRNWMAYTQTRHHAETDFTLLEIRLPQEITQSPLAMETVLNTLFQTGAADTIFDKYFGGVTDHFFSLEMVSSEGRIHFYIWTKEKYKKLIEAQIYSQYPNVEVEEVPDYTAGHEFDPDTMKIFAIEQALQQPDPYPIKTYVDYGLDREQKEEFKIDPLSVLMEFFGTLGKGEHLWMQIVIKAHQDNAWQKDAEEEIEKILKKTMDENSKSPNFSRLSKGDQEGIEAMQKNLNKKPFDAGIRMLYFAKEEYYDSAKNAGLPTSMRAFEAHTHNGFKPVFLVGPFYFPWQNFFGRAKRRKQKGAFTAYKWRSFFYPPYKRPHFVLSAEEIATVYHFPGRVVSAPALERIGSIRAEAPSNLPRAPEAE
ncbi:MAG: hypothetical protein WDZ90_03145 [Candidatus Paceibacterota bacterium]